MNFSKIDKILLSVLSVAALVALFYFLNFNPFNSKISKTGQDWAYLGDYMGGIISPIIAIAVLYFVAKSYEIQRREIKKIQNSMALQSLVAAYSQIINKYETRRSYLKEHAMFYDKKATKGEEELREMGSRGDHDIEKIKRKRKSLDHVWGNYKKKLEEIAETEEKIDEYLAKITPIVEKFENDVREISE